MLDKTVLSTDYDYKDSDMWLRILCSWGHSCHPQPPLLFFNMGVVISISPVISNLSLFWAIISSICELSFELNLETPSSCQDFLCLSQPIGRHIIWQPFEEWITIFHSVSPMDRWHLVLIIFVIIVSSDRFESIRQGSFASLMAFKMSAELRISAYCLGNISQKWTRRSRKYIFSYIVWRMSEDFTGTVWLVALFDSNLP